MKIIRTFVKNRNRLIMKIKYIVYYLLFILISTSCTHEDVLTNEESPRTILVYMAADNSLSGFDKQNINSMLEGGTREALNGGNLIVYIDAKDTIPLLIQITSEGKKVLKSYPEHENSVSVETMKEVIEEVKTNFPAKSYGLMLWSHGSNWFPSDMTFL